MVFDRRQHLSALLAELAPLEEEEEQIRKRMEIFAAELAFPFSRHQSPAHFTASAAVVDPSGTKTCLVHHSKLGRWLQPGGHVEDEDQTMLDAALREAREETGLEVHPHARGAIPLDLDAHAIPTRPNEPAHEHLDVRFLLVASNPEALAHDPAESLGARWLSWDEALAGTSELSLRRLLMKARRLGGWSR